MKAEAISSGMGMSVSVLRSRTHEPGILLGEKDFHGLLSAERKRTERSGNPCLLMLIDVRSLDGIPGCGSKIEQINSMLAAALRETDIIGWYKGESVIGVMLTELGDSDFSEARDQVLERTLGCLREVFGWELSRNVRIQFDYITRKKPWYSNGNSMLSLEAASERFSSGSVKERISSFLKGSLSKKWFLVYSDLVLISMAFLVSVWMRMGQGIQLTTPYLGAYCLSIVQFLAMFYIFDLYNMEKVFHSRQTIFRTTFASGFALAISVLTFYVAPSWGYRGVFAVQGGLVWLFLTCWRMLYCRFFRFADTKLPALIIGAGETGRSVAQLLSAPYSPFQVKGFLDDDPARPQQVRENGAPGVLGPISKIGEVTAKLGIKAVILGIPRNQTVRLSRRVLQARLCGVEVMDLPTLFERVTGRIPVRYIEDQWLLFADGFYLLSKEYVQKIKRVFDFIFSGLLLSLTLPLMAVTALAIRLESKGPVFYKQQRVGRGCKVFTVYKFRSMRCHAETSGARWAQRRDPRVTRVGRWIRIFHIDELPQLWNVFKGDMSLVGPRPERPEFVKELDSHIPYYCVRHTVSPGLTGWAQINYPYGASAEDALRKLEYDLFYIKNMSVLLDFKILVKTIGVVILGEGAR